MAEVHELDRLLARAEELTLKRATKAQARTFGAAHGMVPMLAELVRKEVGQ